jgi:hypothetical protein
MENDKICACGHGEDMHVDAGEQCFDNGCGCKEFEEHEHDFMPQLNPGDDGEIVSMCECGEYEPKNN